MLDFRKNLLLMLLAIHTHDIDCLLWAHMHCAPDSNQDMTEGSVADIGRFPWLGVVQHGFYVGGRTRYAVTGAVLIHPGFAIAAAEDIAKIIPEQILNNTHLIVWGSSSKKFVLDIKDYILHPQYQERVTYATIALLDLISWGDTPMNEWKAPVYPICMPVKGSGTLEQIYAVRMSDSSGKAEKEIINMKYVENEACEEFYYKAQLSYAKTNPVNPLCAVSKFATKPCVWDSGTALITRQSWGYWRLLGFAVHGPGCGAPTRFLNIHDYLPWITDVISRLPYEDSENTYKLGVRRQSSNPYKLSIYKTGVPIPTKYGNCKKGKNRGSVQFKDSQQLSVTSNFVQGFYYLEITSLAQFTCAQVELVVTRQTNAAVWVEHNCHNDDTAANVNSPGRPMRERISCFMYFKTTAFVEIRFIFSIHAVLDITVYGTEQKESDHNKNFNDTYLMSFSVEATMIQISQITLCFLVVSVARGRTYTDEDLASFPKLFHLDEYERCLARVDAVYCLGTFELTQAKQPHPTYELMKAYSDESYRHFNRTRIHRGYCLSSRSPLATSDNPPLAAEHNASLLFERYADLYAQRSDLRASLHTLHYCRTHAEYISERPLTNAELIFKQVVFVLVLANIVGTVYDVYAEDGPSKSKLVSAFSIPANWRRLTFIREGGDPRQTALIPIEGVRVIALGVTTFAHAAVFHYMFHIINPEFLEAMTGRIDGVYLSDGTSLIQGFVMMSTFLTGYNLLIYSQKQQLGIHMLPLCIIKRVVRVTPVHLLIVGYGATWWMYSRDGPLVTTTIGLESEACKTKFWSHVFFFNNIVDISNYCVAPTWFLPVNMHMYILACTFTLLLWRRRSFAVKLYVVLFIASCLMTAVVAYINEYKAMIHITSPEQIRRIFRESASFTEFYMSSWGALPACFLGLILAHIQFELDERKIKLSEYNWFVKFHYSCFPLIFVWSLTGMIAREQKSDVFKAVYLALDRPFFCIIFAIGLMGMLHVNGPIRRFFCWKGWRCLGRMSLTVMMLHWCINMTIGTRPMSYGTSILDILVDWSATNVITYAVAVPITIMVEYPMQKFFDTLFFI